MKILWRIIGKKGKKFKRLPDSTKADLRKISEHLKTGWQLCDRATWKIECRDNTDYAGKGGGRSS